MENEKYYRVIGENGIYLLTREEIDMSLDRENSGVDGIILKETDYN